MSSSITITPVAAAAASTFVQSIGVNVHMGYYWTTYNDVPLVESDLAYLGVDHVRDKLLDWSNVQANYQELAADGIKFDMMIPVYSGNPNTVNLSEFVSMIDAFVRAYPGSITAIEGPNEVNIWPVSYDGGSTLADQALLQQALYAAIRADPNLNGIPVYNLTLGTTESSEFADLGNLSGSANYANSHPYANDAQSPQSYLTAFLPLAQIDAPGLPTVITETGYETNLADGYSGADQTVQAKYTLDILVDAFLDGVSQTYLYELFDEGGQYFGLFNTDGTPKLAATAIHNLTTLLADPNSSSAFTPGSLSYAIPDLPGNGVIGTWVTGGQQLLLEKSNGTFDLVLWNEPILWNPSTESEIAAPIANTTVDFATTQKTVLIFDPLLGSAPIAAYLNVQSISVALTDHPIVVEIPGATATLTTPTIAGFTAISGGPNSGTLAGTAVANTTVLLFDGTTEIGTAFANASGAWSFTTGTLANGANALTAMAVDAAGDVSALSLAFNVTNSAAGPAAAIMAPIIVDDTITSTNQVILTGTGEANSTVSVFDTTLLGTTTVNASGVWTYTTPVLVNGDNSFAVITTDAAGNASGASNYVEPVINLPGPTATSVVATGTGITNGSGDLNAGHVVTLTIAMSEDVTVAGGTPTLTLNSGGTATYAGGSGNNVLTFSYTVATGQNTPDLVVTAVNLNGATITDDNGNGAVLAGTLLAAGTLQIDTTPPAPPVISNDTLNSNNSITLTGTAVANSAVTVFDGETELGTTTASATGTWSYTTSTLASGAHDFTATATDAAGNTSAASNSLDPIVGQTAPTVISVATSGTGITNGTGDLNAGHAVTLTLKMSEAVTVNTTGGTPSLTLNDGSTATYTGGSGSSVLTFSYTVGAGQNTPDLTVSAVNLNGATIADAAGNTASLSGTFNPTGTLQIDTITPTVSSVAASGSGISSGNGDLNAGHVVTLTLNMSEAVTVNTTGGTPTLTLNDGATATYTGGSGSSVLTFSYTVGAGQNTPDLTVSAVNLNGATIADAAGNTASLSGTFNPTGTLQIDTITPTVSSVAASGSGISSGNGDLNAGHVVTLTLNMSEAVTVNTTGGTPTLTLNDGATATYTGGSGSSALTFSYTVAAGQNSPDLTVSAVNLNGATIADAAGNTASLSGTFNPTGTLQIDTTTPAVSSVAASGSGISSGSGDLNAGHVVTLTLNVSEAVTVNTTGGTPTLTLNDGGTATYTGGSGSNALTFSYTVAVGQNTPDLTVTAVKLNGATVADSAGNNASLSGTFSPTGTLQIDTTSPTVASVAAAGSGISSGNGDLNAGHVVALTLNMSEMVTVNTTGGMPTLTLNDGGTATYTGGSGSSALTFSYTVGAEQNTPDFTITAINSNGATIQDGAGNNANLAGTWPPPGTLQIDTTPPAAPVITGEKVHGNKAVLSGAAEASSKITIYEGTVILGTTTASSGGSWTFTTGPLSRGSHTFTATATDAAGNTSVASQPVDPVIAASLPCEINSVYEAALQRAPTDAEVTASLAINSTLGSAGMIAAIVNSAEAITNVYPILQIFNLAFGHFPIAATLASMVDTGLTLPELVAAVVGSQTFANTYNSGTLVNPNSPLTAGSVEAFYNQALGHAPTQATLNEWLNSGLNVAQAFQDLVTSQSYFATTQLAIEQYLTTAANNNAGYANISINSTAADLTPTQIDKIYEAVLQRPPTVTEVTASLALDSTTGDVGVIAALVDSAAAINNVYPILQMFDLAFGHFPSAATLASMVDTDLSVSQLAAAIVASQTFASTYNGGVLINPNSPVTANIVEAFYSEALGHAPTQATLDGWLSGGLTVAQAFEDMVTSQSYFDTTQTSIEQYLTATAINEAGLTTINGALATGSLALGTATVPLTQPGLTVLGGSGGLMVVASGAGDTITELNTSSTGGSITANGAGDTINAANGANTICASGAGDTINLGAVSTGTSITGAQTVHAAGSGDVVTFATMAADGTAVTWAASSMVDGGNNSTGIGANSTVNFGNNAGGGSEMVVVTGDLTGATTSGGTSSTGIAVITLGNVVDGAGDQIIFNNATTEVLAGTSAVNVTSAGALAVALDIAATGAAASQSGGMIGADTGVIDWFQYGGNTYLLEAINPSGIAASHSALAATDEVIKIIGLVNLADASLVGHALTL